jgi:predicted TIM-barrel fold metal-dependent hydrolase
MAKVVDVNVNLRGHTSLPLYDYLQIPKERGRTWKGEELIAAMDEAGVDMAGMTASVTAAGVGGEVDAIHVDEVKAVIDQYPDRLFGWAGINPLTTMETIRYIQYAVGELGFKGVHVYPHWFGVPINDRLYYPIYAKCAELGVPITLQVGSQSPRSHAKFVAQPILLDDVAFDFPELKIVGLHIGTPFAHEMVMLCKNWENVFIIADGHPPRQWEQVLKDYIQQVQWSNKDGSRKVMWGTDHPIQTFKQSLAEVEDLGLEPEVKDNLIGENAIRILGL